MKTKEFIQITIPQPCHEKWEEMTAVERGRFCGSCQKVVTDFTQMEDAEIIQFIKEGKGHCGRFTTAQLDRPLIPALEPPRYFVIPFYKKIAASLLIMAAFAEKTFAQQKKPNSSQQQVIHTKKTKASIIISGHLLDFETQKPIAGKDIYLQIKGFDLQVRTTNRYGFFTFSVSANQQKGNGILSIDTTGTKYIVIEEEVSLEKLNSDLRLFCYSQPELLKPIIRPGYKIPNVSKAGTYKKYEETISTGVFINGDPSMFHSQIKITNRNSAGLRIGGPRQDGTLILRDEEIPSENLNYLLSKPTFWQRITHPFRRLTKK